MRTPTLPLDAWAQLSQGLRAPSASAEALAGSLVDDRASVLERLRAMLERPVVREAITLASPSLAAAAAAWRASPDSARAAEVAPALFRYVTRMATRATPFGLFAAHAVGAVGAQTHLVAPGAHARRAVHLDTGYLGGLVDALARDPALGSLRFEATNAVYRSGGQLRYAERRLDPLTREQTNDTVSVDADDALLALLDHARTPTTRAELAASLVAREGVSCEDAEAFVNELIDAGLLTPELSPSLTGGDPLAALRAALEPAHPAASALDEVSRALAGLVAAPLGEPGGLYDVAATALATLPCPVERARLVQVDLHGGDAGTVGADVVAEVGRAVSALAAITPWRDDPALDRFRERFLARWEGAAVPLTMALDEERGVGFDDPADGVHPLLDGIAVSGDPDAAAPRWTARDQALLERLQGLLATGDVWTLTEGDLARLQTGDDAPLPDSFAALAVALDGVDGAVAHLESAAGPSGARLLGRFCRDDEALAAHVRAHLRAEEELRPEALFAEVVHLPQGRLGNIAARPRLRDWEIPYLCRAGVDRAHQLPIDDLLVRVAPDRRVTLWSRRLDREVLPRMSNAHHHAAAELPIYRFLCALAGQGVRSGLAWSWGALRAAPYLPRVVLGRCVVSPATWHVDRAALTALAKRDALARHNALRAWRDRLRLPRVVALCDGDQVLPVDLDNPLGVDALLDAARDAGGRLRLQEVLGADAGVARGPGGRHAHELVIPFLRQRPASLSRPCPAAPSPLQRTFAPGSEWLYAKVYTGAVTADAVLVEVVAPLVRHLRAVGAVDGWFFVRYADPDPHLRLRFHGEPNQLLGELLPALHRALAPWLDDGRVARVALDTYVREVERYGGPACITRCEALFEAQCEAALGVIAETRGDGGRDARWRRCLTGLDALLRGLGYERAEAVALLESHRDRWSRQLRVTREAEGVMSKRFRGEREALEGALRTEAGEAPWPELVAHVASHAPALRAEAHDAFDEVTASLAHMWVNRVMSGEPNLHEVVLYDFLARLHRSEIARGRAR